MSAIAYAESVLERALLPDDTIAAITDVLRQSTLEEINIYVQDPQSRATERLKRLVPGETLVSDVSLQ